MEVVEVHLGPNRYPVYPLRGVAVAAYQLEQTAGFHGSAHHAITIPKLEYDSRKLLVGFGFEWILDRSMTRDDTKIASTLTIKIKNTGSDP
eukprot:6224321-Amphidinium_carterae.1